MQFLRHVALVLVAVLMAWPSHLVAEGVSGSLSPWRRVLQLRGGGVRYTEPYEEEDLQYR
jgi:hypothetical protein